MDTIAAIIDNLKSNESFVLEAGAGSGKTFALIQTLQFLISNKSSELVQKRQKIVCITYTNVAKNEIKQRIKNNKLIKVLTIHEFLWETIGSFRTQLIKQLSELNEALRADKPDKYNENLEFRINEVIYDEYPFRDFENGKIHHDDVISLAYMMIKNYPTLSRIIVQKYPYIFIDEYQDTAPEIVEALICYTLERFPKEITLGFYGDSYQKIYDSGMGSLQTYIDAKKLNLITKEENYRSSKSVRELLNNFRGNIKQIKPENKDEIIGSIEFINCTNYPAKGDKKVKEYENSLLDIKDANYDYVISQLLEKGWNFSNNGKDKVLIIANSKVASRAGFGNLYQAYNKRFFDAKEELLKRKNNFIRLFIGSVDNKTSIERRTGIEHLVFDYQNNDVRSVIDFLNKTSPGSGALKKHSDKKRINDKLKELIQLRESGTIEDVFNFCKTKNLIKISHSLQRKFDFILKPPDDLDEAELKRQNKEIEFYKTINGLPYTEVIALSNHVNDQNPFTTKHGTKGEEYNNVLVVIDDTSWKSKYNFAKFISNTDDKPDRLMRTRNLFYVSCSRAIENLVVLSLSEMNDNTMEIVKTWFGNDKVTIM